MAKRIFTIILIGMLMTLSYCGKDVTEPEVNKQPNEQPNNPNDDPDKPDGPNDPDNPDNPDNKPVTLALTKVTSFHNVITDATTFSVMKKWVRHLGSLFALDTNHSVYRICYKGQETYSIQPFAL